MDDFINRKAQFLDRGMVARYLPINDTAAEEQLQSDIEEFNQEVVRINGESVRVAREADEAVAAAPTSDDPGELLKALDAKRRHFISDAQALSQLWRRRGELIGLLLADFKEQEVAAEAATDQLHSEVLAGLTELGFDLQRKKAGSADLEVVAKFQHPRVRASHDKSEGLKARHSELVQENRRTKEAIEKTAEFVRAIVDRVATGKA